MYSLWALYRDVDLHRWYKKQTLLTIERYEKDKEFLVGKQILENVLNDYRFLKLKIEELERDLFENEELDISISIKDDK
jgi:hypothetical protein